MSNYKSYFLEKTFILENGELVPDWASRPIIRPCKLSYKQCLDLFAKNNGTLQLEGCIASLDEKCVLEEWLMKVCLEQGISPDFEQHLLLDDGISHYDTYVVKLIDLHVGKTIGDNLKKVIEHLKNN